MATEYFKLCIILSSLTLASFPLFGEYTKAVFVILIPYMTWLLIKDFQEILSLPCKS